MKVNSDGGYILEELIKSRDDAISWQPPSKPRRYEALLARLKRNKGDVINGNPENLEKFVETLLHAQHAENSEALFQSKDALIRATKCAELTPDI